MAGCVSNALIFPKGVLISNKSSDRSARIHKYVMCSCSCYLMHNILASSVSDDILAERVALYLRRSCRAGRRFRPGKRKSTRRESKTRVSDPSRRRRRRAIDTADAEPRTKSRPRLSALHSPAITARGWSRERRETMNSRRRGVGGQGEGQEVARVRFCTPWSLLVVTLLAPS